MGNEELRETSQGNSISTIFISTRNRKSVGEDNKATNRGTLTDNLGAVPGQELSPARMSEQALR